MATSWVKIGGSKPDLQERSAHHLTVVRAIKDTQQAWLAPHSRSNLAFVLYERGRLEEAEAEHRAVVEAQIRVLGPDHPAS